MDKPNLKAPSFSIEAKIEEQIESRTSKEKKSGTIIMVLVGIIICLLLIIAAQLLTLFPPLSSFFEKEINKKSIIKPAIKNKEAEKIISQDVTQIDDEASYQIKKERNINDQKKGEMINKKNEIKNVISIENDIKLKEKTLEKDFNNKISEILSLIEKNQFSLAEKKLKSASELKPNDTIIKDIKEKIRIEIKNLKIRNLIKKAQIEEKNELWNSALNYYEKISKVDSNINSVVEKKQRIKAYIKINKILDGIINKPERLQNDKVLEEAKKSVKLVKSHISEKKSLLYPVKETPKLIKKLMTAEKIIKEASILISITIRSDNLTEVSIYKVGRFGTLTEKQLNLRPGLYTIVGSREGYRDYRKILKISHNDHPIVIQVECRETI